MEARGGERLAEKVVQRQQGGGGVAAAAAQAGGQGKALFQMDTHTLLDPRSVEEVRRSPVDQIRRIHGQPRIVAGKFHARTLPGEGQLVAEWHRLQDGFEFMKTVGPAGEDVEQEVDLAGRASFQLHHITVNEKGANRECRRLASNCAAQ